MNPGCDGKKRYATYAEATDALKRLTRKGRAWKGEPKREVYRCGFCHDYHLGHARPYTGRRVPPKREENKG